jgi:hypothetical protein
MIDDVSNALKSILDDPAIKRDCKELFDAVVRFDRPGEHFTPTQSSTVNLFLYDVREDSALRNNQPVIDRDSKGRAFTRRPPLRVACSYLVTAWVDSASDEALLQEQRLLSQAIQVLSCYPVIPTRFFPKDSQLTTQEPPLPLIVTQMDGVKDPADFWSAIGGKLRPSFVVTVTVSLPVFEPGVPEGAPLVTSRRIDIGERTSLDEQGIRPETLSSTEFKDLKLFGTVTDAASNPVKGAIVTITELDLQTTTGTDGSYNFGVVPKGKHTLRVKPGWKGSKLKSKVMEDVSASAEPVNVQLDVQSEKK